MNNIIEIYNKARKYRWCHYRIGKYYSTKNKFFTIPPIIFASATSFVILNDNSEKTNMINHYVSATLSMLSAMLSGVSMHLGYNAKYECHMMSGSSYDELVTKLDIYIKFKTHSNDEMVKLIEDEILKIKRTNKYNIPQWVFNEYKNLPNEDKYSYNLIPNSITSLTETNL
tara:strand:+ start:976 stop:1488 length:513 start_codon:yes stop_codon:yes gene_type:complete